MNIKEVVDGFAGNPVDVRPRKKGEDGSQRQNDEDQPGLLRVEQLADGALHGARVYSPAELCNPLTSPGGFVSLSAV